MKQKYTEEQVKQVCELYELGTKVSEISEIVGVETSSVTKIAKRNGLELRLSRTKKSKIKKCHNCGENLLEGFRFCPFCGKDVRTDKEICVENLKSLYGAITLLPEGQRNYARDVINSVIAFIEENK